MQVRGTEKEPEVSSQVEGFDAVLVEFERLVVDCADEVFLRASYFIQNRPRVRILLGLRKHEGRKFLPRERARAVEQGTVEIFVQGDLSGVERGEREVVTVLEFFPIEAKRGGSLFARFAIPTIGQNDAANIPKESGDFWQWTLPPAVPRLHLGRAIVLRRFRILKQG